MLFNLVAFLILQTTAIETVSPVPLETVEVRSTAAQSTYGSIAGFTALDAVDIEMENPTHPNELFDRVPGAWVSRGSGQESLIALRSPVLTGPGACGAFMIIEDRVPIRPAGFCNVNELFEVNLLQARRIEVIRGPGSVIYGSNALHGVIDVSSGNPVDGGAAAGGLQIGTDDYYRGRLTLSGSNLALFGNYTSSRSFRVDESFKQLLANAVWETEAHGAAVRTQLSLSDLDQDTAGFVFGLDSYKDPVLRTGNENPEAFRKASALRLSSRWSWALDRESVIELIPYFRSSDMDFLQHFLPGKPLESNGQESAGVLFSWSADEHWQAGMDLEWADGSLVEFQDQPTEGSDFLMETRPQGLHYDYDVSMLMAAAWVQYANNIADNLVLTAGLRAEYLRYEYDNQMLDGNTRDDGSECGFGGCLYTRPADRTDRFENLAPELGLSWAASSNATVFARIARGFRAPQTTELYRLQRGQDIADLDSVTLDTAELGIRSSGSTLYWDLTAFYMKKDNAIFRDANGYNVSGGKTRHAGFEASLDWQINGHWNLAGNVIWAKHEYDFNRSIGGGEVISKGNTVDTAPEWLGGARLQYAADNWRSIELEWVHMDEYYIDAANLHSYEGHDLLNLRAQFNWQGSRHQLALGITNLLDDYYAERADYAFGSYRYFPGAGRRFFVEWRYLP